jgi:hypothetical protein
MVMPGDVATPLAPSVVADQLQVPDVKRKTNRKPRMRKSACDTKTKH